MEIMTMPVRIRTHFPVSRLYGSRPDLGHYAAVSVGLAQCGI
jgi:hypothetical protein